MSSPDPRLLFLDANVLAAPITRTLLIVGADKVDLRVTWSMHAETEAERHLPPRATSLGVLRARLGREAAPATPVAGRFSATDPKDRQILADAVEAGAGFLITGNVRDFDESDLREVGVAAVTADAFMAHRWTAEAYEHALRILIENMKNPPRSIPEMHALMARKHPRLFAKHRRLFDVDPAHTPENPPAIWHRGSRCIRCGRTLRNHRSLQDGLGPECRSAL